MGISRGKESCAQAGKAFAWLRFTGAPRGATAKNQPRACGAGGSHKHGARIARRSRATCSPQARRKETDRANRFAGSRRTARCIAGDEPAGADSPAPGRRVRVLPTAGARACAAEQRHKHGARFAHRRCACVRGFFLLSFAFSCLAFAAQKSFHLSLMPRREFPCLSPPTALFPA